MIRRIRTLFRRRRPLTLPQRLAEYDRRTDQYLAQVRRGDPLP